MNLYLMQLDEIVRWYKPENDNEKYILSMIQQFLLDNSLEHRKELESTDTERDELERELDDADLENSIQRDKIKELESHIETLEDKIESLESI